MEYFLHTVDTVPEGVGFAQFGVMHLSWLCVLVLMAIPIYGINLLLDTNFMFLSEAEEGNPLHWFGQNWGSHLLGFPVLISAILIVMYLPMELVRKARKTLKTQS